MNLALKVDVDTYDGMRDGVPNLLGLFRELGIKASFFIPFGPDESGKAVLRIFKKKGFLKKMFRTNALKLYGIKTALRGTLLPAPLIGSSFPELARKILSEGHELGIHGYNHVLWQDHLLEMNEREVRDQFEKGISSYEKIVGRKPSAFAAPAWLCSPLSLKILDDHQFSYASDTRGTTPFYPLMNGVQFKTLQVPSTLPTVDEILGLEGLQSKNLNESLTRTVFESPLATQVHSIHTEVEGTAFFDFFAGWIQDLKRNQVSFLTLNEIALAATNAPSKAPICGVQLLTIAGRAGRVACQADGNAVALKRTPISS